MSLFQGIFPTQGSNLHLLHCRHILYPLSHWRSPKVLLCYSIEELKRRCEKLLPMQPSYKQLRISPIFLIPQFLILDSRNTKNSFEPNYLSLKQKKQN